MTGQNISHYRVLDKLGEGGMGVVYKAEDLSLRRTVALKFLSQHLAGDEQARRRFLQEAQAAAALSHPNICTIHEVNHEPPFLAMEYLEGQTVKQKVEARPLPLEQAIEITIEAARGLKAAHARSVTHRDIKPANLMLTSEGMVKLMDFGLARLTDSSRLTESGILMGTPAYMSPEQARGESVDGRSDLWSLGVVLYEMVTGRRPFRGEGEAATIHAILHSAPEPLTALRTGVPVELDRVVAKCLAKDAGERYQHADDLLVDLRAAARLEDSATLTARPQRRRRFAWVAVAGVLALAAALGWYLLSNGRRNAAGPARSEWVPITHFTDLATAPALSPDGRMLAFIRGPKTSYGLFGPGEIYVKMLPEGEPAQLTRDGRVKMSPAFSPDGSRIAYGTVFPGWDTWVVPVLGGEARLWIPNASGLVWIDPRRLLFAEIKPPMSIVTATESRTDARDVYVPADRAGMAHRSYLSPDGKWVLLVEMIHNWLPCRLVPFDGSSLGRPVGPPGGCTYAAWSPDGKWMYFTSDAGGSFHTWRQLFSEATALPAPEQITSGPTEEEGLAVAPDGRSLITSVGLRQSAVWVRDAADERQVSTEGFATLPQSYLQPGSVFSPDGKKLYYLVRRGRARWFTSGELWVAHLDSGRTEPLLPDLEVTGYDVSADGAQIALAALDAGGKSHLWLAPLDRRTPPRQLPAADADSPCFGPGGELYYRAEEGPLTFLYRMKLDGSERRKAIADPITRFFSLSPDGEWVGVTASSVAGQWRRFAYSVRGGPPLRTDQIAWYRDGKSLLIRGPGDSLTQGDNLVVMPLRPGQPPPPPAAEKDPGRLTVKLAARSWIHPGPAPATYAFAQETVQRNLYRIPLPE